MLRYSLLSVLCLLQLGAIWSFVGVQTSLLQNRGTMMAPISVRQGLPFQPETRQVHPSVAASQRKSTAQVQLMGLFGLGIPELAIIAVAGVLVVGPTNLSRMVGNFAGETVSKVELEELKKIPEEFQKGIEEGEINVRSRKAKVMEKAPKEIEGSE